MDFVGRARQAATLQLEHARMLAELEDAASRARLLRLVFERLRRGERSDPPASSAVSLRVRALDGQPLYVRPRSSDIDAISAVFVQQWFLPPPQLSESSIRRIVEIGTNIGAALAALAARYPRAQLLGVEPDGQNAELARRNVAAFDGRCRVVQAAAWDSACDLAIERRRREWGLVVRPPKRDDPPDWPTVRALPVADLLDRLDPHEPIDYLFMDVEGTERRLLSGEAGWLSRVRSIRLESEHEYGSNPNEAAATLRRLGFDTKVEPYAWGAYILGMRRE